MNNDNSTKRILDVLGHAIELAQNELEDNPQELILVLEYNHRHEMLNKLYL